jgi:LasA protease
MRRLWVFIGLFLSISLMIGCTRPAPEGGPPPPPYYLNGTASSTPAGTAPNSVDIGPTVTLAPTVHLPPTRVPGTLPQSPTPDSPHAVPTLPAEPPEYMVQPGDTLGKIAGLYGLRPESIAKANGLTDMNSLEVGQMLTIPLGLQQAGASAFKVIPDSELVYGPYSVTLDLDQFVAEQKGYLASYTEAVNGETLTGAQIIGGVAEDYSVNPRMLLALLEYRSRWLTQSQIDPATYDYPLGYGDPYHAGLYKQMTWAANQLNRGFYGWQVNAFSHWALADGTLVAASPSINPGTAGVQYYFAQLDDLSNWQQDVGLDGLFSTYTELFGYPFDYAVEPILPPGLTQPQMRLPLETGASWSFTGGPHGGWDTGSAWAALDFAPPGDSLGCVVSSAWATAVGDGPVLRAKDGAVVQDLDGDGYEQTGWTVLYMHMASEGRVLPGTYLRTGDRVGHPSCEGGYSTAAHLHLARRFDGVWIAADGPIPFNLDGWISTGSGLEYDGTLTRNGVTIPSWDGNIPDNQVSSGN